jgi:hypothetical protein
MFLFETYHSKNPNPIYKIELNKIFKKKNFFLKKKSFEVFHFETYQSKAQESD